jgi:hypothetical protein
VFKALLYYAMAIQLNVTALVGVYGEVCDMSYIVAVNDVLE